MTHNRLGHRFQRRLDVPNWLEPKGVGAEYADKVLATQSANLIAYWPFSEAAGIVADNLEGTAARDGTYEGNPTLGQEGIGDGRTVPLFDGINDNVDVYSASLNAAFDGDEGTIMCWCRVLNAGVWTDATNRPVVTFFSPGFSSQLDLRKTNNPDTFRWRRNGEGTIDTVQNFAISTTDWFHVAMTWSLLADEFIAYLDGVQEGAIQNGLVAWDAAGLLATAVNIADILWSGRLGHPALWNTPLSAAEILPLATV